VPRNLGESVRGLVGVVLVVVVLGAGCSVVRENPAPPVTSSVKPSVPRVARALDLGLYRDRPCALVNDAYLGAVGMSANHTDTSFTDSCFWEEPGTGNGGLMLRLYFDRSPLAVAYEHADRYELFEPFEVLGYPAVVEAETAADGVCVVIVGTADDQGLMLVKYPDKGFEPGDMRGNCGLLQIVGEGAVGTMTA
jgi:Protein of unknown function (DUF3558)